MDRNEHQEFATLEEAKAFFAGDLYATESGAEIIEAEAGHARCRMTLTDHHRNAEGGVMGGAIFTLVDFTFAVASSCRHRPTVAQQVSMNYLSAPKGQTLIAEARCKKDGRTSCVYNVEVRDDLGRDVAQAVMTGFKL